MSASVSYNQAVQSWSGWSAWRDESTGDTCETAYTRTRTCVQWTSVPHAQDTCSQLGEPQLDYSNTATDCSNTSTVIALSVVTVLALILMVSGLILGVMCLRVWVKRTSYNIRQATLLAADGTNVYSDNITLSASQAPPTGCSTSNGTTSSPSVERKEDSSSEELRQEYEQQEDAQHELSRSNPMGMEDYDNNEGDAQSATIELSRSNPMGMEHYTVDHSHPSDINSDVQTTHF